MTLLHVEISSKVAFDSKKRKARPQNPLGTGGPHTHTRVHTHTHTYTYGLVSLCFWKVTPTPHRCSFSKQPMGSLEKACLIEFLLSAPPPQKWNWGEIGRPVGFHGCHLLWGSKHRKNLGRAPSLTSPPPPLLPGHRSSYGIPAEDRDHSFPPSPPGPPFPPGPETPPAEARARDRL